MDDLYRKLEDEYFKLLKRNLPESWRIFAAYQNKVNLLHPPKTDYKRYWMLRETIKRTIKDNQKAGKFINLAYKHTTHRQPPTKAERRRIIQELAEEFGKTEAAIRKAINRGKAAFSAD